MDKVPTLCGKEREQETSNKITNKEISGSAVMKISEGGVLEEETEAGEKLLWLGPGQGNPVLGGYFELRLEW